MGNFFQGTRNTTTNPNVDESTSFQTPEHSQNLVETTILLQKVPKVLDQEIIQPYPTKHIVLNIEEIPSLDVCYETSSKNRRKERSTPYK